MKKLAIVLSFTTLFSLEIMAGGILTNTNQSAAYLRVLARDASIGIDAVYFNPAGLTRLSDGFHLGLNSQTIFQNKDVENNFPYLTDEIYNGKVFAPVFPGVYAAYKTDKLAFSFGFNPVGGGGGAEFERGLPSFEIPVSSLVPMLQGSLAPIDAAIVGAGGTDPQFSNITGYNTNIFFEGTSVYFGFQGGVSYEISEGVSLAAAARYILAKNTYNGYVKDITIDAPAVYGGIQTPGNYLRTVANAIRSNDAATAAILDGTAAGIDGQTADTEVDAIQKGTGFAPILGANFSPTEKLNIGVKYEFATKIELENETQADGTGMFTDKAKSRADLPALLSVGTSYKVSPKLTTSGGFHYFFDKQAYYGKIQVDETGVPVMETDGISFKQAKNEEYMDNNSWELAFGLEYELNEKLTVSAGYLRAQVGVKESYQSDLSFALSSNTFGGGLSYDISNQVGLNLGIAYTKYLNENKNNTYALGATNVNHTDTYMKNNLLLGIGVNFHFGGNE